jgi:soluble lytic murein transglycosylase-like protein
MGGVAGGGLGGLLGGLALGPGGSFAGAGLGTAIGASFDAVSTRIKVLAKDLDDPAKALEAIAAAGVKVSDSERAMSAYLESIGRSGDAFDMARNKMDAAFGPGSFAGLRVLQTSQNDFQAAITNLAGNLGQELLPTVISLTDYFTDLTSTAEPLIEVLGVLGEAFGTATVFIGNNAKFLVDLIAALGGDGDKVGKAFADRFNAKGFGDYQRSTKEKLEAARRNPAVEQRTTPFQDIEQAEKAYAEITRQRDATRGIEQESLSIARQREDIERSISDLQKKWSNTLKQQELQRAQLTSDNLRMGDDLAIERKMNEFDQMRQGLVSDDANALADNLAGYLRERANGEADLRQKEREFAIAKQRMAIEQSQLEEDTAKEVFSITRQAQDYTKAVEDYKIKVADYQYQRALDAMKLSTSMAAVGGGGGGRAGYTPVDLRGYTYGTQISKAAELADVDPRLLRGLVRQESNFSPTARSSAGAYGLTQLTPGTAREMGVTNINDVQQQLNAGAKYLRKMIDQFGSVEAGLRAYNQGPGNQQRSPGGVSQEAREYPGKVLGFAQQYGFSNQVASGPATGWIDKEEFRKWLYSQGMGRAPGDFTNAGHKTPNHMLNAMDMGFMDRKYDSNYVQKTMEMEAKLRATGAFGDQLFGPLSDPKGHGTHLHIPTPGGRVPYNNALAALMQGTGAAMPAGGMSPAAISRTPPTFQTPGGAPAVPSSAGFLASSRAGMEAQITQMEEALGLLRQIQDERAKAMLTNAVNIFQGDANRLSQLESQRDVSREIAAIDGTLPELQQELIANQIQYNAEADKLAASRRESFGVVEELVKLGQLEPEAAAKLNKLLADGYRQRQDILDVERQITEEAVLQARQKELQGAANRIVNFRRGYEAGYGPEAGAYNEALQTYGPGGARVVADAARVERRQQEAASDAQAIAGALTGGIVQAIKSGDFQQAASDALADVGGRLIERAFRPLEEYLMGMLTRLLAPGNAQTGGAAGGLLGLVPGLGSLFSGGGAAAGIGAFGNSGILGLGAGAFGFAKGGDPPVGRASLVGEEGPELFVPRTAGTIIPAADTSSIMDRYSRRSDGRNSTRPVQLSDDAGNAVTVGVRYEVTRVNDMRFVDEETFHRELDAAERRAARAGAEGGHAMVGRDMMNKRSIRSRWGVK